MVRIKTGSIKIPKSRLYVALLIWIIFLSFSVILSSMATVRFTFKSWIELGRTGDVIRNIFPQNPIFSCHKIINVLSAISKSTNVTPRLIALSRMCARIYTHLINFESDEWQVAHAQDLNEENKLIEAGFEYVRYNDKDQVAIYRKRK